MPYVVTPKLQTRTTGPIQLLLQLEVGHVWEIQSWSMKFCQQELCKELHEKIEVVDEERYILEHKAIMVVNEVRCFTCISFYVVHDQGAL